MQRRCQHYLQRTVARVPVSFSQSPFSCWSGWHCCPPDEDEEAEALLAHSGHRSCHSSCCLEGVLPSPGVRTNSAAVPAATLLGHLLDICDVSWAVLGVSFISHHIQKSLGIGVPLYTLDNFLVVRGTGEVRQLAGHCLGSTQADS